MNAEIITIGDEILLGQIVDTNSAWISQQLAPLHIVVRQITSISDKREDVYSSLKMAASRADLIIVTGGLGPTNDDVTKETIANYFNSKLVRDEEVLRHVRAIFDRLALGKTMPDINLEQADVLACADVLFNDVGTAPGMWIEENGKIYVFLPGVPSEMKYLIENRVLPKLVNRTSDLKYYYRHLITVGIGESHLAEKIADIEKSLPEHLHLAYLPKFGLVRLRLSAEGNDVAMLKEETDAYGGLLAERLSDFLVAEKDISLEEAIIEKFAAKGFKLAMAESCTGGRIASAITAVPGASTIFDCAVVAYHNRIKQEMLGVKEETLVSFGAVSEQTVIEMAEGIKAISRADYSIATSGIAGPSGGTAEKPVGTIWVAISGLNEVVTKKFQFGNDRAVNIEKTVAYALIQLWNLFKSENK